MAKNPRYPCMTHLMTRGTFYDVGYNVGLNFHDRIQRYFNESDYHQKRILRFYNSRTGRDYFDESLRVCQDCFPQYVREVQGMADGSGLPFEHVFMANVFEYRLDSLLKDEKKEDPKTVQQPAAQDTTSGSETKGVQEFGCSTVFVNSGDNQLLIHNEDSDPLVKNYGYLLSAEIEEDGLREKFTAFTYPGELPGGNFSFNGHGLAITCNSLVPDQIVRAAPSVLFLTRALLSARDIPDAVRLAQNAPYGCAYGINANISTKTGQMASLEVGPGKPRAQVHVHDVTQQKDPDVACHYYHFNVYKHLKVPEPEGLQSSIRRCRRTNELPPPRTLQQALTIMADTHDSLYPIFRTPRPSDGAETVFTAAFDVTAGRMLLYQGNEDLLADKPLFKLPLC